MCMNGQVTLTYEHSCVLTQSKMDLFVFLFCLHLLLFPELYFSDRHLQVGLKLFHDAVLLLQMRPGSLQFVLQDTDGPRGFLGLTLPLQLKRPSQLA